MTSSKSDREASAETPAICSSTTARRQRDGDAHNRESVSLSTSEANVENPQAIRVIFRHRRTAVRITKRKPDSAAISTSRSSC